MTAVSMKKLDVKVAKLFVTNMVPNFIRALGVWAGKPSLKNTDPNFTQKLAMKEDVREAVDPAIHDPPMADVVDPHLVGIEIMTRITTEKPILELM
jgi:hypothetical protein